MNEIFIAMNSFLESILFFDIFFGMFEGYKVPFLVAWLVGGGVFLTFKMGFVNVLMIKHSFAIVKGKYLKKDSKGEIEPFGALTTALSATVGLGNIAGVAIAISIGGAGATFWMIVAGFLGMTLKFTEVTLSLQYREFLKDGTIMGGAMEYISKGFAQKGWSKTGKVLAIVFAILMVASAFGGGNAFQVSQALAVMQNDLGFFTENSYIFGIIMAIAAGLVIIGGVKRIANITEFLVPFMVVIYVLASLYIILINIDKLGYVISLIFTEAFSPHAVEGGVIGVIIQGFQRAVFSSEAGIGSAPIAHAPSKVEYPIQQGLVALYEPFIDTIIVCTMTAFVIIITGVYDPASGTAELIAAKQGAALTSVAYGQVISWFPYVLSLSITLFAFSTMISWSYYGERAWVYLFGSKYSLIYKIGFLAITIISTIVSTSVLVDLSFMLLLSLSIPNIFALYVLSSDVKGYLNDYIKKLRSGELDEEIARDRAS